jgi:molybdopterin-containing oxidoreductase family iron-sulfur binding subunit
VDPDALRLWRGPEELTETPAFQEMMRREFPDDAEEWTDPVTRRQFLTLMGASLALAGVAGCSIRPAPVGRIMPYVRQPEEVIPGRPLFFATAMTLGGFATGLLVESHEGRPTKVEGNPDHPASLGATDVFSEASVLGLYDPDRSQNVSYRGRPRGWSEALSALRAALDKQRPKRGAGLRILTETVTSPTFAAQMEALLKDFPEARWYQYEPAGRDNVREGARLAFGEDVHTYHRLRYEDENKAVRRADVVVALDADFLACGPGSVRYTRDFIDGRRVRVGSGTLAEQKDRAAKAAMNRLYVVESAPTTTGAFADNRLALRAADIEGFARALAAKLGVAGVPAHALQEDDGKLQVPVGFRQLGLLVPDSQKDAARWVDAVADDLRFLPAERPGQPKKARPAGTTLVLVGDGQPPVVHALAHAMNQALGNVGKTVIHTRPVEALPADPGAGFRTRAGAAALAELAGEMRRQDVDMLVILGGNPVYTAPNHPDVSYIDFLGAMENVPLRIHLGLYQDETAVRCHWHIPEAHYLEAWGDARAYDGTASIVQPLIAPLYGGRSAIELLTAFSEQPERRGYDLVRDYWLAHWQKHATSGSFEDFWQQAVQAGVVPDLANEFAPRSVTVKATWPDYKPPAAGLEVVFRPDPTVYDDRFANNGWLQELPKPVTKLTWDNAALMSEQTAKDHHIPLPSAGGTGGEHGRAWAEMVDLEVGGRKITLPVWVVPGHADNSITVHLGYGRERAGRVGSPEGEGVGFDAYKLRTTSTLWSALGVTLNLTGKQYKLACTQMHHILRQDDQLMEERRPVHQARLAEFRDNPRFAQFVTGAEQEKREVMDLVPGPAEHPGAAADSEDPKADRRLFPLSLYPEDDDKDKGYTGYRWGMAIDLTACTGCSACVVACQAENNSPLVGKMEVSRGREMHWLRIDRYYLGTPEQPQVFFQPVPCQQCEKAPCELVCPVGATTHSHDGLNDMTYNRCVGTRYCSNNCPYKVRRFNFLAYADFTTESLKLGRNPDVTVRSRGVMEKCTYCVQRIREADIAAERRLLAARDEALQRGLNPDDPKLLEANRIRDGEVLTACQAACPAGAIVFGDLNGRGRAGQRHSDVSQWKDEPLNYALLGGLNTQPRTTYLAALRNPNPDLV